MLLRINGLSYGHVQLSRTRINGEPQMRKISLFALAATSVATGFGVWAASITNARVATLIGDGIEPLRIMMNSKQLPAQHYDDFSLVFTIRGAIGGIPRIVHHQVRARVNCSASARTWGVVLNVAVC
jgi:hypothetical protein